MTHPVTPPPELVQQWINEADGGHDPRWQDYEQDIATRAAQWGADQELEACRMEIIDGAGLFYIDETSDRVRLAEDIWTARRPKPPSLKEQALDTLQRISKDKYPCNYQEDSDWDTIRRALEQLPDHE
jgi:hypothetical protein